MMIQYFKLLFSIDFEMFPALIVTKAEELTQSLNASSDD